jgi:hypothetical protein
VRIPHWRRHAAPTTDQKDHGWNLFLDNCDRWLFLPFFSSSSRAVLAQTCNERLSHLCVRFGSPRVKSDRSLDWIDVDELCVCASLQRRIVAGGCRSSRQNGGVNLFLKTSSQGEEPGCKPKMTWTRDFFPWEYKDFSLLLFLKLDTLKIIIFLGRHQR